MGWWMDERGGPVDGTGITNYLIWVYDGSLNGGNGAPRLFQSTDDRLQTWMEITLPTVLTHNVFPGGGPGSVVGGLRMHSSGTIVIVAGLNDNTQPGGLAVFRYVNGAWNSGTFADTDGDLFAGQLNIPLAEGDDGSLYMAASSLIHAGAFTPASIVHKSRDGGVTWSKVYYLPGNVIKLQVHYADGIYVNALERRMSSNALEFYQRRQDRAHWRLLLAIRTLAQVRRLLAPDGAVEYRRPAGQRRHSAEVTHMLQCGSTA